MKVRNLNRLAMKYNSFLSSSSSSSSSSFLLHSRTIYSKRIKEGGIIKSGAAPGFPKDVSANLTVPGESEEPDQVGGGFSWLGYEPDPLVPNPKKGEWSTESVRSGAIAQKIGMLNVWDSRGAKTMCTVLRVDECEVLKVNKRLSGRGKEIINLQLGAVNANPKALRKSELCNFRKLGVTPKRRLAEFTVTEDAVMTPGTKITARHFVPGQFIDVRSRSKAKGFQGGMKRWGFKGQPASHGHSKSHRSIGATGACQDPGKVWKGKKMAGHMGDNQVYVNNMLVYKVDVKRNLLFIRGSLPGLKGTIMNLYDAKRKPFMRLRPPPFPTYMPKEEEEEVDELVMDVSKVNHQFV